MRDGVDRHSQRGGGRTALALVIMPVAISAWAAKAPLNPSGSLPAYVSRTDDPPPARFSLSNATAGSDAPDADALSAAVIWPNEVSHTNSDRWLRNHHSEITQLRPKVLVLLANNRESPEDVLRFAKAVAAGVREGSRYHGFSDPSAYPQLSYQIDKVADMRELSDSKDASPADWPSDWPIVDGSDDYRGLFSRDFAAHYGYPDPSDGSRFLTLCELFEQGLINELWIAAPRGHNIFESKARARRYDDEMQPIGFNNCDGNGCFDPGPEGQCKVTARLMELATDRGPGCALHAAGHGMESHRQDVPEYADNSARFYGFDLGSRYHLPVGSLYDQCKYYEGDCWAYPDEHSLSNAAANKSGVPDFSFNHWGWQCGNVHFAPNSISHYDYSSDLPALSTCEDYGGRHGKHGEDLRTIFHYSGRVAEYESLYGDCGGGWQVYMRQSMPGHGNGGTGDDGRPLRSWWPFLFY